MQLNNDDPTTNLKEIHAQPQMQTQRHRHTYKALTLDIIQSHRPNSITCNRNKKVLTVTPRCVKCVGLCASVHTRNM